MVIQQDDFVIGSHPSTYCCATVEAIIVFILVGFSLEQNRRQTYTGSLNKANFEMIFIPLFNVFVTLDVLRKCIFS